MKGKGKKGRGGGGTEKGAAGRGRHTDAGDDQSPPSAVIARLVESYEYQSHNASCPAARFNATRAFLNAVTDSLTHVTSGASLREVVRRLLVTSLVNEEARVMLQDYLVSAEVALFVRALVQCCPPAAGGLLAGMEAGIRDTISRFPGKLHFGAAILHSWFPPATVATVAPPAGSALRVLGFLRNCCYEFNQRLTEPGEAICVYLDTALLYLFRGMLAAETGATVNAQDPHSGMSALQLAAGLFHMPHLTRLLLAVPGADPNAAGGKEALTAFSSLLTTLSLSRTGHEVLLLLLAQPGLDLSRPDRHGHTCVEYALRMLKTSPSRALLDVIGRVARHSSITSGMLNIGLHGLLKGPPTAASTTECYLEVIASFIGNQQYKRHPDTAKGGASYLTELYALVPWSQLQPDLQVKLVTSLAANSRSTERDLAAGFVQLLSLPPSVTRGPSWSAPTPVPGHTGPAPPSPLQARYARAVAQLKGYRVESLFALGVGEAYAAFVTRVGVGGDLASTLYTAIFEAEPDAVIPAHLAAAFLELLKRTPVDQATTQAYFQAVNLFLNHRRMQLAALDAAQMDVIHRYVLLKLTWQSQGFQTAVNLTLAFLQHPSVTREFVTSGLRAQLTLHPTYVSKEYCVKVLKLYAEHRLFSLDSVRLYGHVGVVEYVIARMTSPEPWPVFALAIVTCLAEHQLITGSNPKLVLRILSVVSKRLSFPVADVARATIALTSQFVLDINDLIVNFDESVEILRLPGYPLGKRDAIGSTLLFDMSAQLEPTKAIGLAETLPWDFKVRNQHGENVAQCYQRAPLVDASVLRVLQQKVATPAVNDIDLEDNIYLTPMDMCTVKWTEYRPKRQTNNLQPTNSQFYRSQAVLLEKDMVYQMNQARKGRACIINICEFDHEATLPSLHGYYDDEVNLGDLWFHMGFQVSRPLSVNRQCLMADEVKAAVKQFSNQLGPEDQCCVVCILSHGGDGFIYGHDGNKVFINDLLKCFDNNNCPAMEGKPKIFIVQACSGSEGTKPPGWDSAMAASAEAMTKPTMSDFAICYPSIAGLESYVYLTPGRGSLYIESLVRIFEEYACRYDLLTMLTWVKKEVYKKPAEKEGLRYHQMPRTETCLTKLLFFFPVPGGMTGRDLTLAGRQGPYDAMQ